MQGKRHFRQHSFIYAIKRVRLTSEKSRGVKGSRKSAREMNGSGSRADLVKMVRVKLWMHFTVSCIFSAVFRIISHIQLRSKCQGVIQPE